jgi:hypothetical protein
MGSVKETLTAYSQGDFCQTRAFTNHPSGLAKSSPRFFCGVLSPETWHYKGPQLETCYLTLSSLSACSFYEGNDTHGRANSG